MSTIQGLRLLKNMSSLDLLLETVSRFSSHEKDAVVGFVCLSPQKKKVRAIEETRLDHAKHEKLPVARIGLAPPPSEH